MVEYGNVWETILKLTQLRKVGKYDKLYVQYCSKCTVGAAIGDSDTELYKSGYQSNLNASADSN